MPLLNYIRGKILWSLERYEQALDEWDVILSMGIAEVAKNGYGVRWAKSAIKTMLDAIRRIVSIIYLEIKRLWY